MKSIDIFPWNDSLDTGIRVIDEQHRELVDLLNRLAREVATGRTPGLERTLDALADYAIYHFETEEAVWREFLGDDPTEQAHRRSHEAFVAEVSKLRRSVGSGSSARVTDETLAFLVRWLASHILDMDRQMASVVQAIRQGLPMDAAKANAGQHPDAALGAPTDFILSVLSQLSASSLNLMREVSAHRASEASRQQMADALRAKSDALVTAHQRLLNILDGSSAAVYVADMDTHEVLFVNAHARALLGDVVGETCWKVMQTGMPGPCDFCTNDRLLDADGKPMPPVVWEYHNPMLKRWFQLHDQAIPWDDGHYVRMEIALDITERKAAEASLKDSEERYRVLFHQSRDALMVVSPSDWRFLAGNPAMVELFGADSLDQLLTMGPADVSPPYQPDGRPSADVAREMLETALREGSCFGEWTHRRLDGEEIPCTVLLTRTELSGKLLVQGTVRDISLQKAQRRQLERIAHYDPLTNLPNRVLLADRMQQAMVQAMRRGSTVAIAYLDLDGFKAINDRYGHDAGDRVLIAAADRMRHALREGDTLARLGGDEFVAVLLDLPDSDACKPTLVRLLGAAAGEVDEDGVALQVSASLGVTFYPQGESIEADQLLRQADQAMYQAKLSGKNRYHFFDMAHDQAVRGHHASLEQIRQALLDNAFVLHYQPKVNMRSGDVVGLEALVRWQHPERGLLPPAEFLPVIENHPLGDALGYWVLESALAQMSAWRRRGLDLPVSVNVSAHQLQHVDFLPRLREKLAAHPDLPAYQLELEVLETSALADLALVSRIIGNCVALGVGFALDDFGTGYSSLTYLKRLPAQTLKIDRSFVRDMLDDPEDLAILEGILGLARAFQRVPIAEGVETDAHGERLLDLGCELAQGYGIARPMAAADVPAWVAAWQPPPCWHDRPVQSPVVASARARSSGNTWRAEG